MNKYSLQTTILTYISISAILIAFVLSSFIVSDHKKSLEQNTLYKMHVIAHDIIEHKLYKYEETELKKRYMVLLKNYQQSDLESLENINFFYTKEEPENLPFLSVYEKLSNGDYIYLTAQSGYIDLQIKKLLLGLFVGLIFVLVLVIGFFHLLLKKLLQPLNCLVEYCHQNVEQKNPLSICDGSYEVHALKEAILKLQEHNKTLCKEKQDIFKEAAHEIKTPIAILKARIDLFDKSDMEKKEFLAQSKNDIHTISNKLRELIFLKAIEWDIQQAKEFVPMQMQCKMMQELFKPILEKKDIDMISNLQEDFSLYIHKEAIGRVMQAVFENIFMNTKNGTTINTYVDPKKHQLKIVNEIDTKSDEVLFSSHIGTKLIQRLSEELEYDYDAYEEDGLFYTLITFKEQDHI